MVQNVGSPLMFFAVWIVGGLLSLFGALSYAELAAAIPEAGGEYVISAKRTGRCGLSSTAGRKRGWPKPDRSRHWPPDSTSIWPISGRSWEKFGPPCRCRSAKADTASDSLRTSPRHRSHGAVSAHQLLRCPGGRRSPGDYHLLKVGLIVAIIVVGLGSGHGNLGNYNSSTPAPGGISGFFAALVGALWAYDGWNNVSMVSSEIRSPQRNLPLALILGTTAVIVIYLLTNLAYFYVLPAAMLLHGSRGGRDDAQILGAPGAAAVSIAAMISIFAALNGSILSGSRVPFAMARDRLFFRGVDVHPATGHPAFRSWCLARGRLAGVQRPVRPALYVRDFRQCDSLWDGDCLRHRAADQAGRICHDHIEHGATLWYQRPSYSG